MVDSVGARSGSTKSARPKDPHEWINNDNLMLSLEGKKIENPLIYEKITYPSHEWDNIPPVIPKFIIQLEKYMEGITSRLKAESELETVASLRTWSENSVNVSSLSLRSIYANLSNLTLDSYLRLLTKD